jgi:hypothetical protein
MGESDGRNGSNASAGAAKQTEIKQETGEMNTSEQLLFNCVTGCFFGSKDECVSGYNLVGLCGVDAAERLCDGNQVFCPCIGVAREVQNCAPRRLQLFLGAFPAIIRYRVTSRLRLLSCGANKGALGQYLGQTNYRNTPTM